MEADFSEITEQDIIDANFEKLNKYKNFKCTIHDMFFEGNVYQKNPLNLHHWRANVARPAWNIDLPTNSASQNPNSPISTTADLYLEVVKSEPCAQENDSLGLGNEPKQKSNTDLRPGAALQSVSTDKKELLIEEPVYYNDDFSDSRDEDWSRSSSRSARGDDFTACSVDDCGYCGRCSY
ncbi:hypothetical protein ONS95_013387 [Cadophora gregata]|uniref:uncharacterized protein n=1 Tax=Cadophora gregata TaxID=51156 RepID=UPI0026DBBCC6|nr:uncharacterized protein ONS95_013387 [Cadophora gregata]KAK0099720.1 hypothetical protein ONS96_008217 [Cadophora gregata f. sp. sojae]KAK0116367.1 hypothetical protein ONS95_013387 [Cadophora gregata]